MAEGEILEEEAVILEEEAVILEEEAVTQEEEAATQEEVAETPQLLMTNYRDNNPRSSMEIEGSLKHSCRNGQSIEASTDSPHK